MTEPTSTVLLTGASGVLGTWLRRCAPPAIDVVSVLHRRRLNGDTVVADLRDREAVENAFVAVRPTLVVHAAYARDQASIVDATDHVAGMAKRSDADLVFVSSEAVFCGDGEPRAETCRPDPVWDYGRWKAAAEDVVRDHDSDAAILRLPLIVSDAPEDHMIRDIRQGHEREEPTTWFNDEMRQPARGDDLARAIWAIAALPTDTRSGFWHLPGPERLSRFDIAARAVDALGLDRSLILAAPTPPNADRPRDLHLIGSRAQHQIRWKPRPVHAPPSTFATPRSANDQRDIPD